MHFHAAEFGMRSVCVCVPSRNLDLAECGVNRVAFCCMHVQLHGHMACIRLTIQLVYADVNAAGGWGAGEASPGHKFQTHCIYRYKSRNRYTLVMLMCDGCVSSAREAGFAKGALNLRRLAAHRPRGRPCPIANLARRNCDCVGSGRPRGQCPATGRMEGG